MTKAKICSLITIATIATLLWVPSYAFQASSGRVLQNSHSCSFTITSSSPPNRNYSTSSSSKVVMNSSSTSSANISHDRGNGNSDNRMIKKKRNNQHLYQFFSKSFRKTREMRLFSSFRTSNGSGGTSNSSTSKDMIHSSTDGSFKRPQQNLKSQIQSALMKLSGNRRRVSSPSSAGLPDQHGNAGVGTFRQGTTLFWKSSQSDGLDVSDVSTNPTISSDRGTSTSKVIDRRRSSTRLSLSTLSTLPTTTTATSRRFSVGRFSLPLLPRRRLFQTKQERAYNKYIQDVRKRSKLTSLVLLAETMEEQIEKKKEEEGSRLHRRLIPGLFKSGGGCDDGNDGERKIRKATSIHITKPSMEETSVNDAIYDKEALKTLQMPEILNALSSEIGAVVFNDEEKNKKVDENGNEPQQKFSSTRDISYLDYLSVDYSAKGL
jgi:hypothetical protein